MSFNLRYNNPGDGINAWPNRKAWVAELIREKGADVVGLQEALAGMLADLDTLLPEFGRVGVGRTDGQAAGEFSAILYRTDRLQVLQQGTFWLSPTPEVVGSRGWDAALERIATWAQFRDLATGCTVLHLNTHFDHRGEVARQESARLIRQQLGMLAATGSPVVMTGDLNTGPTSTAYRVLTQDTIAGAIAPLADAFVVSRTGHVGPTSTFTAFREIPADSNRIDYVLVTPMIRVERHEIFPDSREGRFPSDHLPVQARVRVGCG